MLSARNHHFPFNLQLSVNLTINLVIIIIPTLFALFLSRKCETEINVQIKFQLIFFFKKWPMTCKTCITYYYYLRYNLQFDSQSGTG